MRNGKLRHKMTLQEPVDVQDTTTGEMVRTWQEVAKVWASLEPLSAREFVAAGAEQSEVSARVTIRYRSGVTSKMRLVYRGMAYDIKGVLADPKSGLEYLTLPVGEGVRYQDPAPPAPTGCTITLDGTGIGAAPADVSGQTASVTGAAAGYYGAGTDARPMPASGIVWVASKDMAYSGAYIDNGASLIIVAYDASNDPIGYLNFGTDGTNQSAGIGLAGGIGLSPFLGPFTGLTGGTIGVGHDGEVYAYDRGTSAIVKASDIDPALAGVFASAVTLRAGVIIDSSITVTASVTVVTSQADMVDLAGIAGTGEDWCGNAIEAAPQSCSITLTGDIATTVGGDPLDISGQTVSKSASGSLTDQTFSAGGPVVPLWAAGTRAIGYQASQFTETDDVTVDTEQALQLVDDAFTEAAVLNFSGDRPPGMPNCWSVISTSGAEYFVEAQTDPFSQVAMLVDGATGDVAIVIDGTVYDKSTIPALAGVFTKPLFPSVAFTHRGDPTVYEATIYTAAADLASFGLPAGTLDWCGNAI